MLLGALAAFVICHILYNSNCGHFQSVKHFYSFDNINEGKFLRSSYDYSCSYLHLLTQRKLDVASTWGEINY